MRPYGPAWIVLLYATITRRKTSAPCSGPGIPPRDHKKIFEDFYRAENAMTAAVGGTGSVSLPGVPGV